MTIFDFTHYFRIMLKKISVAGFLLSGVLCFMCGLSSGQTEPKKEQMMNGEQGALEKLYKELKREKPGKDIEIHSIQQTIIKEPAGKR